MAVQEISAAARSGAVASGAKAASVPARSQSMSSQSGGLSMQGPMRTSVSRLIRSETPNKTQGSLVTAKTSYGLEKNKRAVREDVERAVATYEDAPPEQPKLIGGFFWWLILGLCIILDLLDVIFSLFELALAATVIGIVVSAIIYVLDVIIDFTMNTVIGGYYSFNGASMARSLILLSIEFIMEQIPVIEVLPMLSVVFVLIRILENKKRKSVVHGGVRGRIVSTVFNRGGKLVGALAK
jgi:hypothetical protein